MTRVLSTMFLINFASAENFKFWQITDIHYDKLYKEHGDSKKFCHGKGGGAMRFGDYDCESNKELFLSAIDAMADLNPRPEFILWTGDSSPHWHNSKAPDWTYIYNAEKYLAKSIQKRFPDTIIIPVLGNHDAFMPDNFTENDLDLKSGYKSEQYIDFLENSGWKKIITDSNAQSLFGVCGFYDTYLPKLNLRIMALNTNLYYRSNLTDKDPCSQLSWLESRLILSKRANEKVLITGHVPPGYFERHFIGAFFTNKGGSSANDVFVKIINNYSDIVSTLN